MNYAEFNNQNKFNYKNKFNTNNDPTQNSPGHYKIENDKMDSIGIENKLQFNKYRDTKELNRVDFYYTNSAVGPGHGFGNLEISNDIRNSNSSRLDTKEFKEIRESSQLFDYQFQYLDRNFQDPNNIVMSIPRGGNSTREKTQLCMNPMSKLQNVNFTY